ncbi:MAG: metallophosphoesterase [Tepidisphaeraceae bacterium]|jgi:serine/threonine protein phosphatase 1
MRWIVGDIHGMSGPLRALIDAVNANDPAPSWIFVGDYVNRGPDSRGVVETLLRLPNARFCRGNHDDIFDVMINGESYVEQITHNNRAGAYKWFSEHGLMDTLASYGADPALMRSLLTRPTLAGLNEIVAKVPDSHRKFFRALPPVVEDPDIFVIHARWEPQTPDEDPAPTTYLDVDQDLRKTATWGRFTLAEVDAPKTWRRTGYFGHTPVDTYGARGGYDHKGGGSLVPVVGNKIVLLDTAAALSPVGRLTAYSPDTQNFLQADRAGQIYAST